MQIQRNVDLPVFHISRVFSARADALNVAYLRSLSSLHKQEILYYMKHQSLSVVYTVRSLKSVIFTALHAMQTRSSDENSVRLSVCPSVCPSVTRVICDKMEERSVQIYIPYERTFIPLF